MNNLKSIRTQHKISQRRLAELTGVDRGLISLLEIGRNKLTMKTAIKLASYFKCSPFELIGGDAIKYSGGLIESLNAVIDANVLEITSAKREKVLDERTKYISCVLIDIVNPKLSISDLQAIANITNAISKKYEESV